MIKIFYTKKDRELVDDLREEIKDLKEKKEKSDKIIANNEYVFLADLSEEKDKNIVLNKELSSKNVEIKKLNGRIGGYVKQNNKLQKENSNFRAQLDKAINDLELATKRIKELESNRYLKVDIPVKNRNHKQIMKIKSGVRTGKIMKGINNG